jgi:hypothetical protein
MRPRGTLRVLLHAVKSYDMGPYGFTSHPRGMCAADFYRPWKSVALAGFEPATFGSSGKHTNYYTTKATVQCISSFILNFQMCHLFVRHPVESYPISVSSEQLLPCISQLTNACNTNCCVVLVERCRVHSSLCWPHLENFPEM